MRPSTHNFKATKQVRAAFAVFVAIIAAACLVARFVETPIFFEGWTGPSTMRVQTAVCLVLCAVALVGIDGASSAVRRIGMLAATGSFLIAAVTLASRALGFHVELDRWLAQWKSALPASPGSTAIATLVGLVLLSGALLVCERFRRSSQMMAIGTIVIGYVSLLGVAYNADALFNAFPFGAVAGSTAACLLILGLGLLSIRSDRGITAPVARPGPGRELALRLLPITALLLPALGYLRLEGERAGFYDTASGLVLMVAVTVVGATLLILISAAAMNRSATTHEMALHAEGVLRDRIISSAIFGIAVLDVDGRMRLVNPRLCELTGYAADELVGAHFELLVPDADRENAREQFRTNLARTDPLRDAEFNVRRKDGTAIDVLYGVAPLPGRGGLVVNVVDISDRKRLEAQLLQAQKLEGIGRLAGGVAHDFNNILTAIFGDVSLLQSVTPSHSVVHHHAEQITRHAERATELTRQLLSFARKQIVTPKVINLGHSVKSIEPMLRRLIPENVALVVRSLPDGAYVLADASQIEQVIVNLAVNARDAMPDGGRLVIETSRMLLDGPAAAVHGELAPGPYALLAVSDTGVGMDAKTRERIFEPFFTTKELGRGTGLGLSTVYGIVRQFGGNVLVYSEPGIGTTFKIYLPLVGSTPEPPAAAPARPVVSRGSATILLAEDQTEVREVIAASLRSQGYTVMTAETGEQGLAIADQATGKIDLLISDALMPGMSGRDLGSRLRQRWPSLRILLISGYTEEIATQVGLRSVDVEFLPKPFATSRLSEKVAEILLRRADTPDADG